jgi:hypothetical protein
VAARPDRNPCAADRGPLAGRRLYAAYAAAYTPAARRRLYAPYAAASTLMLPLLPIRWRPAGAFLEPKPSVPAGGPPARASPALQAQFETLLLPEVRPIEIEGDRRRSKEIEGDRRGSKEIEGDRRVP